jgi:hypothetical protein
MMTMHFAEPMPFLEYPLRIPGTDSSHDAFVCLDRRIVGARRVGAVQAVMMTTNALGDLSVAEQMPVLDHQLPVKCCAWRNYSVKMPISHTSATVRCIHDEDVRREVRLEMRRWLTMGRRSQAQPMKVAAMVRLTQSGAVSSTIYSTIGIERLLHRRIPVLHALSHAVVEMHLRVFGVSSLRHDCLIDWHELLDRQVERCERIIRSSELLSHHFQLAYYWSIDSLAMHGHQGCECTGPSFDCC